MSRAAASQHGRTQAPLELSVVDQAPVRKGGSGGQALRESIELAVAAERLGYQRFWVAEHHNLPSLAATSPEILIGQIAAATDRIRVGSGGVMLLHYSALKVAENFHMLESLFPGRIDLGLGRAPGGDPKTAAALAYPAGPRDARFYPEFSYAHFFGASVGQGPAIVERYRKNFRPSPHCPEPLVNVALSVLCAETQEEVDHHAISLKVSRLNMVRGIHSGIVPPEEAKAHEFTAEELAFLEQQGMSSIQGTPDRVGVELEEIAERFGTRDLGIVTICYDFAARIRSYELVAQACGLAATEGVD